MAEDVAIICEYIHISTDAIAESDPKDGTYYSRIWECYKLKKTEDAVMQPMTSVQTRLK